MAKKKAKSSKSKSKSKPKAVAKKKPAQRKSSGAAGRKSKAAAASSSSSSAPPAGPFIWHELMTTDVSACKRFYSQMFGWSSEDSEMMPGFIYTMFKDGNSHVGGMMAISPEMGEMKPHWLQYVYVKDVDKSASKCESLGGEICVPAHDIPVGRFAILRDPTGAEIAIFKPQMQ